MTDIAVLVHGAGSCPATAALLLAPAVPDGATPVAVTARADVESVVDAIAAAAHGCRVVLVAGISLGAHAAALWTVRGGRTDSLVLAMPAWTGAPGPVAALTERSAAEIARRGRAAVLAEISAAADGDWVVEELRRGWETYDDGALVAALRAAAGSTGPTRTELAAIRTPTAVVALADDPLHPESVARTWSAAIPGAALGIVGRHEPATDRGALGRTGRTLLLGA